LYSLKAAGTGNIVTIQKAHPVTACFQDTAIAGSCGSTKTVRIADNPQSIIPEMFHDLPRLWRRSVEYNHDLEIVDSLI